MPLTEHERVQIRHQCTRCRAVKSTTEFHRAGPKGAKSGVRMPCKECQRPKRAALQRLSLQRSDVKAKQLATSAAWRRAHPEYERERSRRRWKTDLKYRFNVRRAARAHARKNPAYYALAASKRRALLAGTGGSVSVQEWAAIIAQHSDRCAYCGKRSSLTQDHVVPISKGGSHSASNIVPACKPCNSRKRDRLVRPMLPEVLACL